MQRLCEKALAEQTKDVEITVYLIESLVRVHEFRGLRDGFQLAAELVDRFWDKLYPLDEDGESTRSRPLESLNNAEATLIVPIGTCRSPLSRFPLQITKKDCDSSRAPTPGSAKKATRCSKGSLR